MSVPVEVAVLSAATVFVAYMVRGIAGFGSGLVAIPLLALNFPLTMVVPLVVLLDYLGSATQGIKNRELIRWNELLPLLPFTACGVGTALYALHAVDPAVLARVLGAFVIAFAVYQLVPLPELRGSRRAALPYGFLGGLVGTAFGTGGPFYVMYLNLRGLDKGAFRASFATYFLVDGSLRLAGYGAFGFFDRRLLTAALIAIPIAGAGLLIGGRIHTGLSQQTFKRLISVLLLASGSALLLKS